MIYILKTEKTHTTVDCSEEAGEVFLKRPHAHFNRRRKLWTLEPSVVPATIRWLRDQGHTVILDDDADKGLPQPLAIGTILEQIAARGPTGSDVYARGLAKARAAIQIANATAETARAEWAKANPGKHPWSPEANRYVMNRAADASNATLDAIELAELTDTEQP